MTYFSSLIKFSKKEYIEALHKKGHLHFQPLNYFTQLEDTIGRGDELESVTHQTFLTDLTFKMKDIDAPDTEYEVLGTGDEVFRAHNTFHGNIFCLHLILFSEDKLNAEHTLPEKYKKFGKYYLVIKSPQEFLSRVSNRLKELQYGGKGGLVTYKDFSRYTGRKTYFEKDSSLAWQNEYRILINNIRMETLDITIGSLEDISEIACWNEGETISFFDVDAKDLTP